jgi:transposase
MQRRSRQSNSLGRWLTQLMARAHQNVAIVALANKLVRVAWAVLHKNEPYRPPDLLASAADTGA